MELAFIVYSILKQCWRVGYVSLLTLSFIKISPEPMVQFQPNLAQIILKWREFKFVQMKDHQKNLWLKKDLVFSRGDNNIIANMHWRNFNLKNHLLKAQCANFNQTWHKASLDEGDSSFACKDHSILKRRLWVFSQFFNEKFRLIDWHWSVWRAGGWAASKIITLLRVLWKLSPLEWGKSFG